MDITESKILVNSYFWIENQFVLASEYNEPIEDSFYIKGGIDLKINETWILRKEYGDYIGELWPYIINGLYLEVSKNNPFSTTYPSHDTRFSFIPINDCKDVLVEIYLPRQYVSETIDCIDFMNAMLNEAESFFGHLINLLADDESIEAYQKQLRRITEMKKGLNNREPRKIDLC
ncbi:MAG: hypothetical protein HC921_22105 [Synechococcaceae cyanobacterium SM2_3_1]|nr:hypothetical protein [Synechococcaceae cyanobacterium SM2_3_1]